MTTWRVDHGDCLDVMRGMADASVDAVVTDPPYGLSLMGQTWDHRVPGVPFWAEALRVAKPGAHLVAFGGTRTFHRLTCAIEDAGWEVRDCLSWLYATGFPKSHNGPWGGTALKPAWEPVILARKPLIGTVAANVAEHGTGALNIDGCRIEAAGGSPSVARRMNAAPGESVGATGWVTPARPPSYSEQKPGESLGRWPANVMLDESSAAVLDAQTGELTSGQPIGQRKAAYAFGSTVESGTPVTGFGDSGGASRFYYVAKASRSEREAGLREAVTQRYGEQGQGPDPKQTPRVTREARNTHTTVKPVAVMAWLCRLVTPAKGIILDPFAGSGTTGVAAIREGFNFIGIEREANYVDISRARIAATEAQSSDQLALL